MAWAMYDRTMTLAWLSRSEERKHRPERPSADAEVGYAEGANLRKEGHGHREFSALYAAAVYLRFHEGEQGLRRGCQ